MLAVALPSWNLWSNGEKSNGLFVIKNAMCCEFNHVFHILCHFHETWRGEKMNTWALSTTGKWKSPSLLWCQKSGEGQVPRGKNPLWGPGPMQANAELRLRPRKSSLWLSQLTWLWLFAHPGQAPPPWYAERSLFSLSMPLVIESC